MSVGAHDRAVDHGVFIVRIDRQPIEQLPPHTALGPSAEARVNRLAMTEALRQIAPRDARPVALQHGIDEQPIVLGRHPDVAASRPRSKSLIRSHCSSRRA
jgi:hypothetical protein